MLGLFLFAAAATPAPACTAVTARRATVQLIGEHLERYQGKCVRVGGLFASIALYGSVADLYVDSISDPAALRRGRIGLYSADGKLRGLKPISDGIPHVEITGIVDSCGSMREQAVSDARANGDANPIIMMGGYCHYYTGTVIRSASYRFDPPRRYDRLTGEASRKRFGDLVAMPQSWRHRVVLERDMADWRAMIDRRDRAALRTAHDYSGAEREHERQALDRLLDPSLVSVTGKRPRQSQIFIRKIDVDRVATGREIGAHPYAMLCLCRTAACVARWPIAGRDADNHPSRPYVCTRTNWRSGQGGRRLLETWSGSDGGLGEPRRTAMER